VQNWTEGIHHDGVRRVIALFVSICTIVSHESFLINGKEA